MTSKLHHIAVLIDCEREQARHWFELFQQLKQYLKSEIHFIMWDSNLADIARNIVDIDKVHLMSKSLFNFNDYKSINLLIKQYIIERCILIGKMPQFITWKLKQNTTLSLIRVLDDFESVDKLDYSFIIYPNHTAKVNYQQKIAYTPFPLINYRDFLDLDTQAVLDIKQNISLISYDNHIINKSFVCGHIGVISDHFIKYLEYHNCEWYDISTKQGSFVLSENLSNNLPIVYELLDCLIVSGELDNTINYQILNAIASGTIVIAPREDQYQELLGKGAIYYNPSSSSELAACIDIIQKNENKKFAIREQASEQFQRKYSYQAIAQFWAHLLARI
ncbi:glycosyltransferase family 1 protein [bacterium]|nr:glycosyltransferase family 1 protein [Candidatus Elulimicrobium humile]